MTTRTITDEEIARLSPEGRLNEAATIISEAYKLFTYGHEEQPKGTRFITEVIRGIVTWLTDPDDRDYIIQDMDAPADDIIDFMNAFFGHVPHGVQEVLRYQFAAGYCFYFAKMLETAFPGGTVSWAAPYDHMVYVYKGHMYDANGREATDPVICIPISWLEDNGFSDVTIGFLHNKDEDELPDLTKPRICTAINAYLDATRKGFCEIPYPYTYDSYEKAKDGFYVEDDGEGRIQAALSEKEIDPVVGMKHIPVADCIINIEDGWQTGGPLRACVTRWCVPDEDRRRQGLGTKALREALRFLLDTYGTPEELTYIWNGQNQYVMDWLEKHAGAQCTASPQVQKTQVEDDKDSHIYKLDVRKLIMKLGLNWVD